MFVERNGLGILLREQRATAAYTEIQRNNGWAGNEKQEKTAHATIIA